MNYQTGSQRKACYHAAAKVEPKFCDEFKEDSDNDKDYSSDKEKESRSSFDVPKNIKRKSANNKSTFMTMFDTVKIRRNMGISISKKIRYFNRNSLGITNGPSQFVRT